MDKLFESLKGFVKKPDVVIDNHAFRLHYRATFVILIAFSLMVTSKQYFGDPIDCISKDDIPSKLLDTYCWIHTTFSIENAWKKRVGEEVPYPGVDKTTPNEKRIYHAYYQWVCFVLFFQALFFYVPRSLWKAIEGNRTKNLIQGLNSPVLETEKKNAGIKLLLEYFRNNENQHNSMFYFYFAIEVFNLINVIIQMMIMDKFLGGEFSTYGWNVINFTEWDWTVRFDPMIKVFPRLTKCTFHRYGSSGDVQKHDAMCILPINIVNEKIYVFLWFWFYLIAIVSVLAVIYRLSIYFFHSLRVSSTNSHCRLVERDQLTRLVDRLSIGDWFMLDLLSRNIDPVNFKALIQKYDEYKFGKREKA